MGAQRGGACERAFSIIRRAENTDGLEGVAKIQRFLDETNTPGRRNAVDMAMRPVMNEVMREVYTEALDLADVPTVQQLKSLKNSAAYGERLINKDLDVHHTTPKYLLKRMLEIKHPDWTPQQVANAMEELQDAMPGMLMHKKDHVGIDDEGLASFHRHLNSRIPPGAQDKIDDVTQILEALEDSYQDWNRPEVWDKSLQWLLQEVFVR